MGTSITLLTDGVALFYASLNGVDIAPARWQALSAYADRFSRNPASHSPMHAAWPAMVGNLMAIDTVITGATGPAAPWSGDCRPAWRRRRRLVRG